MEPEEERIRYSKRLVSVRSFYVYLHIYTMMFNTFIFKCGGFIVEISQITLT